jgi:hypothetical protein
MRNASRVGLVAVIALVVGSEVRAQEVQQAESPHTLSGNLTIASDYRFRGISQTFGEGFDFGPAIQGGIDYAHASGFYLGNWNSNVSGNQFTDGDIEMDLYGGWKRPLGGVTFDLGTIYYAYPRAETRNLATAHGGVTGEHLDTWEASLGVSWKALSVRYFYALTDYFGLCTDAVAALDNPDDSSGALRRNGSTHGTQYLVAGVTYPLPSELTLIASLGYTWVRNYHDLNYADYRIGVGYDWNGWLFGAAFVGTDADGNFWYATESSGDVRKIAEPTVVFTVGKVF